MPTVLLEQGFRFFFYSNENNKPAHIHVRKGNAEGKIWLVPELQIAYLHGFSNGEQKNIIQLAEIHHELFKKTME